MVNVKTVKRHHLFLKYSCIQFMLRSAGPVAKPALECSDTQYTDTAESPDL